MKKRYVFYSMIILFILINSCTTAYTKQTTVKNFSPMITNNTIYVDDDNIEGPWDGTKEYPFQYITDGISNSTNGDNIYVFPGIYNKTITIDRAISLNGEDKKSTIIDGQYTETIITITIDKTTIENFTIRNSGGNKNNSAIKIESNNNKIINCSIYRARIGILIKEAVNNQIDNCSFDTNGLGIKIYHSDNNTITGCCFCHNSIGIHIENSNQNKIYYCYINTNGISCILEGSKNSQIFHCNISNNMVNLGGLFIINCINIFVDNSIISHNGAGIHIFSSDSVFINYCEINLNTHYAVVLRTPSKNIVISNCNIKNNFRYAFYFEKMNSCKISNCNIYNNSIYAIYSKLSYINAKLNYWGSPIGPSFNFFRKNNGIMGLTNIIKFFPWSLKLIKNIGTNWHKNEPFMEKEKSFFKKNIVIPGLDSDLDGTPDYWEEKWGYDPFVWEDHANLDPDNDGLNNIEECYTYQWNSSPIKKDIFLEIDWIDSEDPNNSNKPSAESLDKLVSIFEGKNITLHYDIGNLGGGEMIHLSNHTFSFAKMTDVYWDYFLHNNLNNPRKGIFHYCIICDYCPDLNYPFFGWDQLDSFAVSIKWIKEYKPLIPKDQLLVGAVVHHLGHSLGLIADKYGGIDNLIAATPFSFQWWEYHNYKSCMNYYYKYKILSYSDGTNGRGDFDDWANMNFSYFKNTVIEWPDN
ncbi:MAG: right-handed parallel beta-helix repeat-containing protein [Candidatus Thermoplasmatota archaeon]|nr:right-handed parallel beta-helix repeat-containing protein [Candidatus Thermoplasmatota archaeon]